MHLTAQVPMGLWAVTRVENGRQSYLYLDANAYGLVEGGSHHDTNALGQDQYREAIAELFGLR